MSSNIQKDDETSQLSSNKKTILDRVKDKGFAFWNRLILFEKISTVCIIIFLFSSLIAFVLDKNFAGSIAFIQIVLIVVALLMKKQIIKTPKSWLYIVITVIAAILILPFCSLFGLQSNDAERFIWTDIAMHEIIPEPESHMGEIQRNSNEYLSMNVYRISEKQYNDYINKCKNKGFTIEIAESDTMFSAYNDAGYELRVHYYVDNNKVNLFVSEPEKFDNLKWPAEGLATFIPEPEAKVGRVDKNDEKGFIAYVGNTSKDEFAEYIELCFDRGFSVETSETEKQFLAKNAEGYKLTLSYQGNNVVYMCIEEPVYNIDIKVKCVENWIFSKYDVKVYIDNTNQGKLSHGGTDTYSTTLTKGTYTLKFVAADDSTLTGEIQMDITMDELLEYKISCSSAGIDVDVIGNEEEKNLEEAVTEDVEANQDNEVESSIEEVIEPEKEENLTIENCEDLALILSCTSETDSSYSSFASKYNGKIIEFDGNIFYLTTHENYKTRYEMLLSVGDYDEEHRIGPDFKFDEIATYEIDYGDLDSVSAGTNVHIIAEVVYFDSDSYLFYLEPIAISVR